MINELMINDCLYIPVRTQPTGGGGGPPPFRQWSVSLFTFTSILSFIYESATVPGSLPVAPSLRFEYGAPGSLPGVSYSHIARYTTILSTDKLYQQIYYLRAFFIRQYIRSRIGNARGSHLGICVSNTS